MLAGEPTSALKLKDGLWVGDDLDCKFNVTRPARRWPKCAIWLELKDNKVIDAPEPEPGSLPMPLVIADGTPTILEFPMGDDDKKKGYAFAVLEPARSDTTGHAVEVRLWFVACGIDEGSNGAEPKIRHFPGMDDDCHPASVAAIRTAAAAGPQGSNKKLRWRWVRARAN
jgi:hypothetical protein